MHVKKKPNIKLSFTELVAGPFLHLFVYKRIRTHTPPADSRGSLFVAPSCHSSTFSLGRGTRNAPAGNPWAALVTPQSCPDHCRAGAGSGCSICV